jgi:hypothetical protein
MPVVARVAKLHLGAARIALPQMVAHHLRAADHQFAQDAILLDAQQVPVAAAILLAEPAEDVSHLQGRTGPWPNRSETRFARAMPRLARRRIEQRIVVFVEVGFVQVLFVEMLAVEVYLELLAGAQPPAGSRCGPTRSAAGIPLSVFVCFVYLVVVKAPANERDDTGGRHIGDGVEDPYGAAVSGQDLAADDRRRSAACAERTCSSSRSGVSSSKISTWSTHATVGIRLPVAISDSRRLGLTCVSDIHSLAHHSLAQVVNLRPGKPGASGEASRGAPVACPPSRTAGQFRPFANPHAPHASHKARRLDRGILTIRCYPHPPAARSEGPRLDRGMVTTSLLPCARDRKCEAFPHLLSGFPVSCYVRLLNREGQRRQACRVVLGGLPPAVYALPPVAG